MISLLANVPTLEEFKKVMYCSDLDIQNFEDFLEALGDGRLSMQDPLGALLAIADFRDNNKFTDILIEKFPIDNFIRNEYKSGYISIEKLMEEYPKIKEILTIFQGLGANLDKGSTFLIQGRNPFNDLQKFIQEWSQQEDRIWNPPYAPINHNGYVQQGQLFLPFRTYLINPSLEELCIQTPPGQIISKICYIQKNHIISPFTPWEIAHCLQLSYENSPSSPSNQKESP